jgi:hypothetical protein
MAKKKSEYSEIIDVLRELKVLHPSYSMGRHIATALDDCGDVWGMRDKELLFSLEKYKSELDMNIVSDDALDNIVNEGMNLFNQEDYGDY